MYPSTHLFAHISVHPFMHLYTHLSTHLSMHFSMHPSVHLSHHPSMVVVLTTANEITGIQQPNLHKILPAKLHCECSPQPDS